MGVPSSITLLSFFHTFFLSLFLLLYCISAASDILTANQSIKYGEYLTSSNGIFQLAFFTPTVTRLRQYVGIQFVDGSPDQAVWVANRENPTYDDWGIFTFGKNGNLVILDRRNNKTLWATSNASELSINESHAQLLDSGNLVLREGTTPGYGRIIWESFNHPSHALLPGMKIGINLQTRETKVLRSWASDRNPAPGDFTFGIDPQHLDQFFVWRRSIPYWRSFYWNGTAAKLVRPNINDFSQKLINFSIIRGKEEVFFTYSPLEKSKNVFMLGPYGSLYFTEDQSWPAVPTQLSGERESCSGGLSFSDPCGVFSSCNHNNTMLCKCLPGFEPLDPKEWNAKDWKGGCRRRSKLECGTRDGFMPLRMKLSLLQSTTLGITIGECKELCVKDCTCNAFSYNVEQMGEGYSTCEILTDDISALSESWEEDGVQDFYLRLAPSDLQNMTRNMTRMCPNCGTNIIPYPLSTSPNCGDPAYMRFHCENATGQLRFRAPDDSTYAIINMDKNGRTFVIQLEPLCWPTSTWFESKGIQLLTQSSPFRLTRNNTLMLFNCSTLPTSSSLTCNSSNMCERYIQEGGAPCFNVGKCCSYTVPDLSASHSFNPLNTKCNGYMSIINANLSLPTASWLEGLEIGWDAPKEPICDSPVDCIAWPNTKCLPKRKRCICMTNFTWDPMTLTCIYADGKRTKGGEIFRNRKSLTLIIPITVVMGSLMLGAFFYFFRRMVKARGNQNKTLSVEPLVQFVEDGTSDVEVQIYDFDTVSMATDEFSDLNKLGQGGFGAVYKGKLQTGQEIAVKRLSRSSGQGVEEFKNEVILISKLQHRNLVRLMGYCIDRDEKILLYEYMPNKGLDFFLFDKDRCQLLDWTKRITIILGIARGLLYLHEDSRMRIIHRDLKTSNILLDEELNPKISDFGLARIFGGNQIEENTNRVVGTYGYISPEYASHGIFSMKSDVFSFGVILVEIITGQKNTTFFHFQDSFTLLGHAWQLWMEEKALDLVDPSIRETCDTQEVLKCLQVGLLCVQEDAGDRPNMANVVAFFVSQTASLPTPKRPAFFIQSNLSTDFTHRSSGRNCSRNEVTMSSVVGR